MPETPDTPGQSRQRPGIGGRAPEFIAAGGQPRGSADAGLADTRRRVSAEIDTAAQRLGLAVPEAQRLRIAEEALSRLSLLERSNPGAGLSASVTAHIEGELKRAAQPVPQNRHAAPQRDDSSPRAGADQAGECASLRDMSSDRQAERESKRKADAFGPQEYSDLPGTLSKQVRQQLEILGVMPSVYQGLGMSEKELRATAKDMRALGGHGKEDFEIIAGATQDMRSAVIAYNNAKTPAEKARWQARIDQIQNNLPPDHPQRQGNQRLINRFQQQQQQLKQDMRSGKTAADAMNSPSTAQIVAADKRAGNAGAADRALVDKKTAIRSAAARDAKEDSLDLFGPASNTTAAPVRQTGTAQPANPAQQQSRSKVQQAQAQQTVEKPDKPKTQAAQAKTPQAVA